MADAARVFFYHIIYEYSLSLYIYSKRDDATRPTSRCGPSGAVWISWDETPYNIIFNLIGGQFQGTEQLHMPSREMSMSDYTMCITSIRN
jgi:hypothetical protein